MPKTVNSIDFLRKVCYNESIVLAQEVLDYEN